MTLHADGSVQVDDDGRGIPTDINAKSGLNGVELVLTRLHAGGKFGGSGYKTSGGLHGVGASAVNALSLRFDVTVQRDGKVHELSFQRGVPGVFDGPGPAAGFEPAVRPARGAPDEARRAHRHLDPLLVRRPVLRDRRPRSTSTSVRAKLRNTAFLVPGVAYVLRDETGEEPTEEKFHYPNGLTDMVEFLTPSGDKPVSGILLVAGEGTYKENAADANGVMQSNVERRAEVEVAFRWGTGYDRTVECFTNTIRNVHGGTHRKGFERALVRALTDAIRNARGLLKPKEDPPVLDDVLEGMTAVIHVRMPEPQFTSQTKDELSTAGITRVLQTLVEQHIKGWIDDRRTKAEARTVLQKIVDAARVRLTQKQQKDAARRKTALEGASMPPKLVDCRSTGIGRSELYIVEGDSALGHRPDGPQLGIPGAAADPRQDPQRAEGQPAAGAGQRRVLGDRAGARRRLGPHLRPERDAVRPRHDHGGRRRRRLAHPHAADHPVRQVHATGDRGRAGCSPRCRRCTRSPPRAATPRPSSPTPSRRWRRRRAGWSGPASRWSAGAPVQGPR